MRPLIVAAAVLVMTTPAIAAPKFAAYEGRDAIHTGNGGTRITKAGVDFWTTGTPPRKFQVLGIYTDKRNDYWVTKLFSGDAIGSKGIAKQVRKIGGDAVIVLDRKSRYGGSIGSYNSTYGWSSGWGWGSGIFSSSTYDNITTALLVVRYVGEPVTANSTDVVPLEGDVSSAREILERTAGRETKQEAPNLPAGVKKVDGGAILIPAATKSGYCIQAPPGYRGTGASNLPAITSALPPCSTLKSDY